MKGFNNLPVEGEKNQKYSFKESENLELLDSVALDFDYSIIDEAPSENLTFKDDAQVFLSFEQKIFFITLFFINFIYGLISPIQLAYSFIVIVNILYLIVLIARISLMLVGKETYDNLPSGYISNDDGLPIYSIMVPLYLEADIIERLITNLNEINYPKNKLQVLLVLEESDKVTQAALKRISLAENYKVILVPHSYPKTKPKACNYALQYVTGEYLVIYDAEDAPDKLQLRKALYCFLESNKDVVCCQAMLNYYNYSENWLTSMFAVEYAILFNRILPALEELSLPIPLGGSSNHFKVQILKSLGGWDSYNVTEDADIGIRYAKENLKVRMFNSITAEESPISLKAWLNQRARWIKGFWQTYFIHMRSPIKLFKALGLSGFISFTILFAVVNFLYLALPITLCLMIFLALGFINFTSMQLIIVNFLSYSSLFFGIVTMIWSAYDAKKALGHLKDIKSIWTFPLYITLLPIAGIMAFYQIITKLHFWSKTQHGVSKNRKVEIN
jgi:hypothetical protein